MVFQSNMLCSQCDFSDLAILMQDWLSLWTLQTNFDCVIWNGKTRWFSSINVIQGMTSLKAWESAMYSASAVLNANSVCSLLAQCISLSKYARNFGHIGTFVTSSIYRWPKIISRPETPPRSGKLRSRALIWCRIVPCFLWLVWPKMNAKVKPFFNLFHWNGQGFKI